MILDTLPLAGADFSYLADGDVVLAAGWDLDEAQLLALVHDEALAACDDDVVRPGRSPAVRAALAAWVEGDVDAPTRVGVRQRTGGFLPDVWAALRRIPGGAPVTYAELARLAGRPTAVRAAAQGCARNNIALFVPCHRVVRTSGALGGFAYGLGVKESLLAHEGAAAKG